MIIFLSHSHATVHILFMANVYPLKREQQQKSAHNANIRSIYYIHVRIRRRYVLLIFIYSLFSCSTLLSLILEAPPIDSHMILALKHHRFLVFFSVENSLRRKNFSYHAKIPPIIMRKFFHFRTPQKDS